MALDQEPARSGDRVGSRQPERLGAYRLVSRLGEGGMGVVHLGLDRHGRAVAIKVLRPHVACDEEARWRLEREVDTLGRIRSERVAAVIDSDISGDRPYVVTRYVAGPSLEDVVTDEGPLAPRELVSLGRGLVEALEAIHDVGVVHRDLKPGNVLLEDGEPVVIDFGIAHLVDDVRLTSGGLVMGTPGYLSPEVVRGEPVTQATDWWGWAATLAFAASGRPPFGRGPMDVVLGRVSRGDADLTGVDDRLSPLLAAALSPDPVRRPPAREVVSALERYASGAPATVSVPAAGWTAPTPYAGGWVRPGTTSALPSGRGPDGASGRGGYDAHGAGGYDAYPVGAGGYDAYPVGAGGYDAYPVGAGGYDAYPAGMGGGDLEGYGPDEDGREHGRYGREVAGADWAEELEPDGRIGRPMRTGTLVALAAALTAGVAVWAGVAILLAVLWCWLARFSDRCVTALVVRRYRHGYRRADVPLAVALSPWHLAVSAVATVAGLVLPAMVGASAAFSAALAISAATASRITPGSAVAVAVGFAAGTLVAWWGPGGASLRRGSRSLARGVAPGRRGAAAAVGLLLMAAAALTVLAATRTGPPVWWPFPWGA